METIEQKIQAENTTQHSDECKKATVQITGTESETKASKRNKGYDLGDVRYFTEKNAAVDYKILLALYEHRALTPAQLSKGWFATLHENSIRNRTKTLAERKILTVNVRPGIKTRPVKMYSLSTFGLRILTENLLQVMEYVPHYNELKEHYTIDDLKVRSQHNHHHELQEWVIEILSTHSELFHCEWRRYPFIEENEESVRVKPDWLFLEADEETIIRTKENRTNNPLLYPFHFRRNLFSSFRFTPTLCVECDRGTMSRMELVEKWEGYKALPKKHQPHAISIFYTSTKQSDMRHRLIRETLSYSFELEVIRNQLQLFQGDPQLSAEVVTLFLERNKELLHGEEMTNEKELTLLIEEYNRSMKVEELSILDVNKTVERFKLPVKPDFIIMKQQDNTTLQLIFYAIPGWVNPFIKIKSIKKWLIDGQLSMFSSIQYILLYPDSGFFGDVRTMDDDIFYVSYNEIKNNGIWGSAHYEQRKHRRVGWLEVNL